MALISQMIEATKQRIAMPDLRISVLWATLSIVSATIVLVVSLVSYNPLINLVWFAIPVIGIPANIVMARKSGATKGAKTVIDTISDKIWKSVGLIAILQTIACIIFNLLGYPQAWLTMFFYAFIVVGFGAAMTGIILKELLCFRRNILNHRRLRGNSHEHLRQTPSHRLGTTAVYGLLPADVHRSGIYNT